jgi:hypothetical protein
MRHMYKSCTVDVTPDFSLGQFFAHARITRAPSDGIFNAQMCDSGDLGRFNSEAEAMALAYQWAIAWVDEHGSCSEQSQAGTFTSSGAAPPATSAR